MVVKGNVSESHKSVITITELVGDEITKLSAKYWLHGNDQSKFDASVIENIYHQEIFNREKKQENRIAILELSHYLENYLWPNFSQDNSTFYHVFSIILMVNERVNEGLKAFELFKSSESKFKLLFEKILEIQDLFITETSKDNTIQFTDEHIQHYIRFFINCFQNLEDKLVKTECLKICSYPIWLNLSKNRFQEELSNLQLAPLKKKIQILKKKANHPPLDIRYQKFLYNLIDYMIKYTSSTNNNHQLIEIFLELVIDLITLITTRRFFYSLLDDSNLLAKFNHNFNNSTNNTINELLNQLYEYKLYQINNFTGEELTKEFVQNRYYSKIQNLQTIIFKDFQEIKNLSILNFSKLENPNFLYDNLSKLTLERLQSLASQLNLVDLTRKDLDEPKFQSSKEYLLNLIVLNYSKVLNLNWNNNGNNNNCLNIKLSNQLPLYPTEKILWNRELNNQLLNFNPKKTLPLPKLNLQYLSFNDYLSRNFYLTLLESSLDIKNLIEDSVKRLSPVHQNLSDITYKGWSRMAIPINSFKMINVHKPLAGEKKPRSITAAVAFQLDRITQNSIIDEWNSIKEFDQLFLISLKPLHSLNSNNPSSNQINNIIISSVRGCQVIENSSNPNDKVKVVKVSLDSNQYQLDSDNNELNVYKEFNILLRLNPKESNFKAILDNCLSMYGCKTMSNQLPDWLFSLFLGYPDPSTYNPTYKDKQLINHPIHFNDTFLDLQHLKSSYPDKQFKFKSPDQELLPPFKITHLNDKEILIESYLRDSLEFDKSKLNTIPFVPTQIKAIQSAMLEGLTLIVGPPGTGKTDVAVQIISNIYHNHPTQKTLILTHSNQALNQIFEKIQKLNIHERYLLRLGHGTKQLKTGSDFSKPGRIDYILSKRIEKLSIVEKLATSINCSTDVGYSCETALNFFSYNVVSLWEKYIADLDQDSTNQYLVSNYPFKVYFNNNISETKSYAENKEIILNNWLKIESLFKELEEYQVFELLKSPNDRYNYLLLKQCKIVAMTCTHAVLKRNELIRLGFKFDNILMEESAQISDVESFIPIQLQQTEFSETNRLKRLIMIGDHNQLSPIVKNLALQKYSHFDQSLFTRFIELSVPYTLLDQQGRCRESLSELFKWKYQGLKDLDYIQKKDSSFQISNPGFVYDYQLINVTEADGYGKGEIEPYPHFFQNLGEAEYIVAVYQFMRLLGYPSEKISVLTTYKGQKALLINIFQEKCKNNPVFGMPHKITTVDKYQGQQNDYILLSLVRTKSFGHIRDVRRLVVAMSRARLGLYLFCNRQLYQTCYETISSLSHFLKRPDKLMITQGLNEVYGDCNRKVSDKVDENQYEILNSFHMQSLVQDNI